MPPEHAAPAQAERAPAALAAEALAAFPWLAERGGAAIARAAASRPPEARGEPVRLDLTEALRDAYLRRIQAGAGGGPIEVTAHRMRLCLPEGQPEDDRLLGLRFLGVVAAAAQAHRREGDDDDQVRWVADRTDWVGALAAEDALPPAITAAVLGHDRTLVRWVDAAEDLLWLEGSPIALGLCRRAPVLFELAAEGVLPSGAEARFRLFVAAEALETRDAHGSTSLEATLEAARAFLATWAAYRDAQARGAPVTEDLRLEWLAPDQVVPPEDVLEAAALRRAADGGADGDGDDDATDADALALLTEAQREQRRAVEEALRAAAFDLGVGDDMDGFDPGLGGFDGLDALDGREAVDDAGDAGDAEA